MLNQNADIPEYTLKGDASTTEDGFKYEIVTEGKNNVVKIIGYTGSSTEIVIPDTIEGIPVTSIEARAFDSCSSLTTISIPESVTSIGDYAFYTCRSLTTINIPEGVTSIGSHAFCNCRSLTTINIPEGVASIEDSTFTFCSSLTTINIPEGVTSIGESAFSYCSSLTTISIPESVTSIGNSTFSDCSSLNSITVEEGNNNYVSVEGVLYNKEKTIIYCYPAGKNGTSYTVLESVTNIEDSTFSDCSSLTTINIPEGVTSIGESVFDNCSSLTTISIPESVTSIGDYAFYTCRSLTTINIPKGVTSIGRHTFENCRSLTTISIPESVTSIGDYAFSGCSSLNSITVEEGNNNYVSVEGVLYDKEKTIIYCYPAGKNGTSYTVLESVTSIEDSTFYGCSSLTTINIPEGVTSIGGSAFYGCSSLTTINIPEGVTSIRMFAFSYCSSLTTINIPTTVSRLESRAFASCEKLKNVIIPKGVTYIDKDIFNNSNSSGQPSLKPTIICAENSLAKGFAINNNLDYILDSTYPNIEGVNNEGKYEKEAVVTPIAKDDNLKVVYLYKNGEKVNNYENGKSITGAGTYEIVAIDIVGNETKASFTIGPYKGDVNEDDKITATDLLKIKQHIIGLKLLEGTSFKLGDINSDNKISTTDLLKIKRIIVGLE